MSSNSSSDTFRELHSSGNPKKLYIGPNQINVVDIQTVFLGHKSLYQMCFWEGATQKMDISECTPVRISNPTVRLLVFSYMVITILKSI